MRAVKKREHKRWIRKRFILIYQIWMEKANPLQENPEYGIATLENCLMENERTQQSTLES
jgi:hypothetical protein